jgi:hypothetical protein
MRSISGGKSGPVTVDLTGKVYGKLTVTGFSHVSAADGPHWFCTCTCGGASTPSSKALKGGTTKSCGCPTLPRTDITGRVFGRLTVVGVSERRERRGTRYWICKCECGGVKEIIASRLLCGNVRSCGCLHADVMKRHDTPEDTARARLYSSYKSGAKNRGYVWDLPLPYFKELIAKPCLYCGSPPEIRPGNKQLKRLDIEGSGLDRIDNNQGYVIGNVVPCCTWCNTAKRHHSMMDFVAHCRAVASQFPEVGL